MSGREDGREREPTFEEVLAKCKPEDFDGHTGFDRLTPEERLDWLDEAAAFVHEFKGLANRRRRGGRAGAGGGN